MKEFEYLIINYLDVINVLVLLHYVFIDEVQILRSRHESTFVVIKYDQERRPCLFRDYTINLWYQIDQYLVLLWDEIVALYC